MHQLYWKYQAVGDACYELPNFQIICFLYRLYSNHISGILRAWYDFTLMPTTGYHWILWILCVSVAHESSFLKKPSAQSLRKKNKRNPVWITSCPQVGLFFHHACDSPHCGTNKLASPRLGSKGLEKKTAGLRRVTTVQPSAHIIHVGSMMFEKHPHQTQSLLPNWWAEKYEFMKMNKGGGETQWKSWASPGTSSINVCTSVFPPNGNCLISLSQKVPVPFHGSKGMCKNESWLEGKLYKPGIEGVKCQLRDDHWWYQYLQ